MWCTTAVSRPFRPVLILAVTGVAVVAAAVGALAADRFADVAGDHPHAEGIGWVADAEITLGCGDGAEYCPSDEVSRGQMATFMHRLSGNAPGIAPSVDAATVQGHTPADLEGEPGPEGPEGPAGPEGPEGPAGEDGADADTSAIEARLDALESRVDDLEADNAALESTVSDQADDIAALEATVAEQADELSNLDAAVAGQESLLAGVERQVDAHDRDTLVFTEMNLQVVNGTGTTSGEPNGLGNLIIGYDTERSTEAGDGIDSDKSGSHYLVVGDQHNYTAFGGILAGFSNIAAGDWASVTGGSNNTASGSRASVSGGISNTASGAAASVSGGSSNTADGLSGSSVSGGRLNTADGDRASVSGGSSNTAEGSWTSILGGDDNTVDSENGCHPSCD